VWQELEAVVEVQVHKIVMELLELVELVEVVQELTIINPLEMEMVLMEHLEQIILAAEVVVVMLADQVDQVALV
tara:strand:- start:6 stop:227 length:222 start_codon:yes stop_codon:yes gene_type:complete